MVFPAPAGARSQRAATGRAPYAASSWHPEQIDTLVGQLVAIVLDQILELHAPELQHGLLLHQRLTGALVAVSIEQLQPQPVQRGVVANTLVEPFRLLSMANLQRGHRGIAVTRSGTHRRELYLLLLDLGA